MAKPEALLFLETQVSDDPELLNHPSPLWKFYPRSSLAGDGTNRWAPNLAGLRAVLEECLFRIEEEVENGVRAAVRARAFDDVEVRHYRELDYGHGLWGRTSPSDLGSE